MCLTILGKSDGVFRAVHRTRSCNTTFTKIGDYIICLYAGCTGFVYHCQYRIVCFSALKGALCVVRKRGEFIVFFIYAISQNRQHLVFEHCSFLVNATTPAGLCIFGRHAKGNTVYFFNEFVVLVKRIFFLKYYLSLFLQSNYSYFHPRTTC